MGLINPGASPESFKDDAEATCAHLRWLSETIGPRGSCRDGERKGAEYAAHQFAVNGFVDVELAAFSGAASTYYRFALTCGMAALATLTALLLRTPIMHIAAMLIQTATAQAMLFESDFRSNWSRALIPDRVSQNVIARQAAAHHAQQTIILVAHIDTARTPALNASRRGQHAYILLLRSLFLSHFAALLLHIGLAFQPDLPLTGGLVVTLALQLSMLVIFLAFERAPFSPGAYDNASGAACILALAQRFKREPLLRSEIWYCLTGCEETGAAGAVELYERITSQCRNPWIINLDQLGYRQLYLRTEEGLLRRYATTDECVSIASETAALLPEVDFTLRTSQAFSDATPAYQRGLRVFSFGTIPAGNALQTYRHTMSDTPEHLSPAAFAENLCYIWSLIHTLDMHFQEAWDG